VAPGRFRDARRNCGDEARGQLRPCVAASEVQLLIDGESGTSKDILTKYLHYQSRRWAEPLLVVNSAIRETLLESELFNYEKRALSDARQQ
jgi:transcriptional regulator with GAF, ATPase, and Fis domain